VAGGDCLPVGGDAEAVLATTVALAIHDADASATMTCRRNPRTAGHRTEEPTEAARARRK
jgi:hypothetical protein